LQLNHTLRHVQRLHSAASGHSIFEQRQVAGVRFGLRTRAVGHKQSFDKVGFRGAARRKRRLALLVIGGTGLAVP